MCATSHGPCQKICTSIAGSFNCCCNAGYNLSQYICNGRLNATLSVISMDFVLQLQILMNAYPMEVLVHVNIIAQIPLGHTTAVVNLAMHYHLMVQVAMVRNLHIVLINSLVI